MSKLTLTMLHFFIGLAILCAGYSCGRAVALSENAITFTVEPPRQSTAARPCFKLCGWYSFYHNDYGCFCMESEQMSKEAI